ncbi:glycine--tRNA ligase subunit beta [Selenomonas sp. CM52]|uniref:glycine--tRNA ligase subunit beta n=1 Tax=Selenomonas sp. CM52 TaxID=936381 RepID=UPI00027C3D2C|nr:glycine--tRNA ligase subunit beta [Selenomonas sp. CM52]EJU25498.1 glycine--tRNA ligase, beta subunit [Selenomonas sp. CM52]
MSKDLLLEIGTEEIPAHAMPGMLKELGENAKKALKELRLVHGAVRTLGTPRRLALVVEGLAEKQEDVAEEKRGPSVQVAFDAAGKPTKAAEGFARGQGLKAQDLVVRDGYVYALVEEKGESAEKVLAKMLPDLISGLPLPNSMRWGDLDFRFIRPLRWLVALYGDQIVPFELACVKSGNTSRGHRFLSTGDFTIEDAAHYEEACEKAFVIVDPARRKALIEEGLVEAAKAHGGTAEITPNLLEEVLYLVEYPTALAGSFEDKYLALPPDAVITPMRDHQRYFPVKSADGKLLPLFLTVRNGGKEYLETVQHGNERVLRARLADAQFFFDEDRKKSLAEHLEKLKTVVFQEGLGTVYDKSLRLEKLAGKIADAIGANDAEKKAAMRAALLSKADLVTGMVTEFTELQGVMGKEYARLDGEGEDVALAIDEHYMPRFAGDAQPKTRAGLVVSLADKMDNIVATFSRGLIPTGSQDPFALRRQALGMVHSIIEAGVAISLHDLVDWTMDLLKITDAAVREKMQADVADFMRLRLKNVLAEEGIRYDIADAVLGNVDDVRRVLLAAKAVRDQLAAPGMADAVQAFVRVANLAAKAEKGEAHVDAALFETDEEKELMKAYASARSAAESLIEAHDFVGAIDDFKDLAEPINAFFDAVMVMADDEKIRKNRLALLKGVDDLLREVADFSKIVQA